MEPSVDGFTVRGCAALPLEQDPSSKPRRKVGSLLHKQLGTDFD
jgi:hypothetical protein